jgi:hypothetical protein
MNSIEERLFARYGVLMGGTDLYAALGFKSYSAFYRAKEIGELGVNVFQLPGRRGWFALTETVGYWLQKQASHSENKI